MTKVNLDTLKPWVTEKITEILSFEDDVVIEFIFNQLDERVRESSPHWLSLSLHVIAAISLFTTRLRISHR